MGTPSQWQIEQWPLSRFIPYARNPRKNDAVVDQMAAVIKEFGFKIPVLAKSSGLVVDGHLRLKAAERLKLETVPVILCDEWTDAQVKAFRLLVNRSATWAEWDNDLLALEMADLKEIDFDLTLTGFGEQEIAQLFSLTAAQPDEWLGMPEYDQEDRAAFHTIKVHFRDEDGIAAFAKLVEQKLTRQTRSMWFPAVVLEPIRDKQFVSAAEQK